MNPDVLKPELLWIEGRCYRINDPNVEISALQEHDLYENDVIYDNMGDEGDDDDFEVTMIDCSRFSTSFHVSKHYIGSIIGRKGATKGRIEQDTKTEIKIPRHGQTGNIVILGPSAANVKAARRRINSIVVSSRLKQRPTHFISLPLTNSTTVKENFEKFKELVLKECPGRGLDESIFMKPQKLHITFGVMCLMDNEERMYASKLMNEAKTNVVMPLLQSQLPLKIRVKGLAYMNDDPREINVLYGKVQVEDGSSDVLQQLADGLVDHFYKAGYMKNEEYGHKNVKLHATLINTKYRSEATAATPVSSDVRVTGADSATSRNSRTRRETFDGSAILEKYADYDFGVVELSEIHLSQIHATAANGYYPSTSVISCKEG